MMMIMTVMMMTMTMKTMRMVTAMVDTDAEDDIDADHDKRSARYIRVPAFDEVPYPVMMEPNLVVEYYSR